jgi:phosphoribosylglycinamide formyltransferase-1
MKSTRMNPGRLKAAVLISGTGSNLKALIDAVASNYLDLDIVRVISNRADAAGIGHARSASIPVSTISHRDYPDRISHDRAITRVLEQDQAELIILAGYMRILSEEFTEKFSGRMINLHPSLLPLYKGLDTYNRALQAGDSETGASIHFVTAGLDSGPVIAQVRIPIRNTDDASSLATRLGPLEHKLLVATVAEFCQRRIRYENGQLMYNDAPLKQPLSLKQDGTF